MNWTKRIILAFGIITCITLQFSALGQEVITLYHDGKPSGNEYFTMPEKQTINEKGEIIRIENVSSPTLTVVRPEAGKASTDDCEGLGS